MFDILVLLHAVTSSSSPSRSLLRIPLTRRLYYGGCISDFFQRNKNECKVFYIYGNRDFNQARSSIPGTTDVSVPCLFTVFHLKIWI